jgi:hypothetical protein
MGFIIRSNKRRSVTYWITCFIINTTLSLSLNIRVYQSYSRQNVRLATEDGAWWLRPRNDTLQFCQRHCPSSSCNVICTNNLGELRLERFAVVVDADSTHMLLERGVLWSLIQTWILKINPRLVLLLFFLKKENKLWILKDRTFVQSQTVLII